MGEIKKCIHLSVIVVLCRTYIITKQTILNDKICMDKFLAYINKQLMVSHIINEEDLKKAEEDIRKRNK
jgi:hypothetical protein